MFAPQPHLKVLCLTDLQPCCLARSGPQMLAECQKPHGLPGLRRDCVPELHGLLSLCSHHALTLGPPTQPLEKSTREREGWPFCLTHPAAFEISRGLAGTFEKSLWIWCTQREHSVPRVGHGPEAPSEQGQQNYPTLLLEESPQAGDQGLSYTHLPSFWQLKFLSLNS